MIKNIEHAKCVSFAHDRVVVCVCMCAFVCLCVCVYQSQNHKGCENLSYMFDVH